MLMKAGITPNQVTTFNFVFTITAGCYCYASGLYFTALAICLINGLLDYIDGDLAVKSNRYSALGVWIDTGGDVILQNAIMAALAYGLISHTGNGVLAAAMFYFVGNSAMNLISFHYNDAFGFNSHSGSQLFRKYMDSKPTLLNRFLKNLIDPTASGIGTFFYTIRYFIVIGTLWNMNIAFYSITIMITFRWVSMYLIYALYLAKYKKLWVIQALLIMDDTTQEFYNARIRNS